MGILNLNKNKLKKQQMFLSITMYQENMIFQSTYFA